MARGCCCLSVGNALDAIQTRWLQASTTNQWELLLVCLLFLLLGNWLEAMWARRLQTSMAKRWDALWAVTDDSAVAVARLLGVMVVVVVGCLDGCEVGVALLLLDNWLDVMWVWRLQMSKAKRWDALWTVNDDMAVAVVRAVVAVTVVLLVGGDDGVAVAADCCWLEVVVFAWLPGAVSCDSRVVAVVAVVVGAAGWRWWGWWWCCRLLLLVVAVGCDSFAAAALQLVVVLVVAAVLMVGVRGGGCV